MSRYKLLTQQGYSFNQFSSGAVYDEEYVSISGIKVKSLIKEFPHDWRLMEEKFIDIDLDIIGYKLKDNLWYNEYRKSSFLEGVCKIGLITGDHSIKNIEEYTTPKTQSVVDNFKSAGVLDLWFTPIYKKSYPDISINGHQGEFLSNSIKFGCAEISAGIFIELYKLRSGYSRKEIESVTIGKGTFSRDQIKEIAEYYLNK